MRVRTCVDVLAEHPELRAELAADAAQASDPPADLTDSMTTNEYARLVELAVIDKTELINGRVVMGRFELVFGPEQAAAAAQAGVRVRTCVDVLAEHPELRAELAARLAAAEPPATVPTADAAELTEQHLAEVTAGLRDPRTIPPPPRELGERLDGPADLLACRSGCSPRPADPALTLAGSATSPHEQLGALTPAQWADRRLDPHMLLIAAWRDAARLAQ